MSRPKSTSHKRGDPVPGMPGFVYINPRWPAGKEPCVERADNSCIACDGDGSDHRHPEDPDSHPCRVCGGTGIGDEP